MEAFIAGAGEQAEALARRASGPRPRATPPGSWPRPRTKPPTGRPRRWQRARAIVSEAEAQRDRVLAQLAEEQAALVGELRRLGGEHDEVRDGLTSGYTESLHRTISELPSPTPAPS